MIQIKNLSKYYGVENNKFYALDNVSLQIEKGEFVVVLGPSGSGKSTLVNIIGGIDRGNTGEVLVHNKNIQNMRDNELTDYRAEKIGFVFQFYNLIQNLTVEENIQAVLDISKNPLQIDKILEAVGILDQKYKFPKELSGGQQQRTAIARALIKNPEILLCDEPTGALDYKSSKEVLTLLREVNEKFNTTVIIITHNNSIAEMATRVIKLKSGEITKNYINENPKTPEEIDW